MQQDNQHLSESNIDVASKIQNRFCPCRSERDAAELNQDSAKNLVKLNLLS